MKRCFAITVVVLCSMMCLTIGCKKSSEQKPNEEVVEFVENTAEKGEKGKFEMSGDVPPAPGDEEFSKAPVQVEPEQAPAEPEQKQSQKQM
jgi:hypothetical protein